MVDVMTSPTLDKPVDDDFEDGELPEEGEITDDDEPKMEMDTAPPPAPAAHSPKPSPAAAAEARSRIPPPNATRPKRFFGEIEKPAESPADAWASRVSGGRDQDYRTGRDHGPGPAHMDGPNLFGDDIDYREGRGAPDRRRRRTPSPPFGGAPAGDGYPDYPMAKRGRQSPPGGHGGPSADPPHFAGGGRGGPPFRGRGGGFRGRGRMPPHLTARTICKFFREGYCRDGDHCVYSHRAEDSLRKPELCKFYQNGYCKKGLTCPLLHGEWPCKPFHQTGQCAREPCPYSHVPLCEYTQPLFDKMVALEEHVQQHVAARRRVLLPGGPPVPAAAPPLIVAPQVAEPIPGNPLPPPSVVVPTLAAPPAAAAPAHPHPLHFPPAGPSYSPNGYASPAHHHHHPQQQHAPAQPHYGYQPGPAEVKKEEPAIETSGGFNITAMLAQIAGGRPSEVKAEVKEEPRAEESPASPQRESFVEWRLVEVDCPKVYSTVAADSHAAAPKSDPRLDRVLASQFDAVSSLIAAAPVEMAATTAAAAAPKPADPRQMRDPRRRPDERRGSDERPVAGGWMPQIRGSDAVA